MTIERRQKKSKTSVYVSATLDINVYKYLAEQSDITGLSLSAVINTLLRETVTNKQKKA